MGMIFLIVMVESTSLATRQFCELHSDTVFCAGVKDESESADKVVLPKVNYNDMISTSLKNLAKRLRAIEQDQANILEEIRKGTKDGSKLQVRLDKCRENEV